MTVKSGCFNLQQLDPCGTNFQASAIKVPAASSSLSSAWKGRHNTLQNHSCLLVKGREINLRQQSQPDLSCGDCNVKSDAKMVQHQLFLNHNNFSQILYCSGMVETYFRLSVLVQTTTYSYRNDQQNNEPNIRSCIELRIQDLFFKWNGKQWDGMGWNGM